MPSFTIGIRTPSRQSAPCRPAPHRRPRALMTPPGGRALPESAAPPPPNRTACAPPAVQPPLPTPGTPRGGAPPAEALDGSGADGAVAQAVAPALAAVGARPPPSRRWTPGVPVLLLRSELSTTARPAAGPEP